MATNFTKKNISSINLNATTYNIKAIPFHGTEAEWSSAEMYDYIPKRGEIIVYDVDDLNDYERLKLGDGITTVPNLPFYLASEIEQIKAELDKKVDVTYDDNNHLLVFMY